MFYSLRRFFPESNDAPMDRVLEFLSNLHDVIRVFDFHWKCDAEWIQSFAMDSTLNLTLKHGQCWIL